MDDAASDESPASPRHRPLFLRIGELSARHCRLVALLWLVLFISAAPFLLRVEEPLKVGGFSSDRTEGAATLRLLQERLDFSPSSLVVIYQSKTMTVDDPTFRAEVEATLTAAAGVPNVISVVRPWEDESFIAPDRKTAYALVGLSLPTEEAQRVVPEFRQAMSAARTLTVHVAGGPAFYADIETVSQQDLRRAEIIAFPFALVALLLVFGSVAAALVPLIVGGLSVAVVLVTLYAMAHTVDISIFSLNLASMLGLGLSVDYSLFITSRFREELTRSEGVVEAVGRTIGTAGRAIFFSGLTVLIGLSGLIFFDFMFLRSVGIAGVIVVVISVVAALTLLPALLALIGHRIDALAIRRRRSPNQQGGAFWIGLSRRVMARPVATLLATMALLIFLGLPFWNVNVSSPDATILPKHTSSRIGFDVLVEEFGPGEVSPLVLAFTSPTSVFEPENIAAAYDLVTELRDDPRVARIEGFAAFEEPLTPNQAVALVNAQRRAAQIGIGERFEQFAREDTALILVYLNSYANAPSSKELLATLRDHPIAGDLTLQIGGGTAEIVDVVDEMYGQFPLAIALIVVATYVVLLLTFRAVLLPLKAIAMNTLSILASYGALVWIFQDGHLEGLLRFEELGFVEASLPIIMFCVLFGLSMDYEVFLLTRVREEWDRTHDNEQSVALGLQRSGQIITSAAIIVVVVTGSFVSADVILVKALGLGIAIAVFLDATIVRALLVPATMRLLGDWNWWMPGWLDRLLPGHAMTEEL